MNDSPTVAEHPERDDPAGPDRALADELRRAVGARAGAAPAGPGPGAGAIADLAAARARRRKATRAVVAVATAAAVVAGAVAGWTALRDDPGSVVVVAGPGAGEQAEDAAAAPDAASAAPAAAVPGAEAPAAAVPGAEAPAAAAPDAGAPGGAEPDPATGGADDSRADGSVDGPASLFVTPEELSTGPVLRWSEAQTGLWDLWGLQSLGDGRVLAYASHNVAQAPQIDTREVTVVTADGVAWSQVELPAEVTARQVAADGDRWVVAGFSGSSFLSPDGASRVFVSDDAAATWTELALDAVAPAVPAPRSPWVEHRTTVISVLASGTDIVLALGVNADLDVEGLVEASGLLPDGRSAVGWGYYGESGGTVSVTLADTDALVRAEDAAPGEADYGAVSLTGETLQFTFEELGLTVEEQDALFGEPSSLVLLWSDGETVEATGAYGGRESFGMHGAATGAGFVVHLVGMSQGSILSSPDGRTWTEHTYDGFGLFGAVVHGGSVWAVVDEPSGPGLARVASGAERRTVAGFGGLLVSQLHAGPAGLAATATPSTPNRAFDALDLEEFSESGAALLEGETGSALQDSWVGWSADGAAWGWQTMTEAFGVGADEAWIELGVGRDFVVAAVRPFGPAPVPAPDGSGALVAQPPNVRVFVAAVP